MRLYFQNSKGEERLISECETVLGVQTKIRKFLAEHNFKSCYTRNWRCKDRIIFDVGSHTEFFILEGITLENYIEESRKNRE